MTQPFDEKKSYLSIKAHEGMIAFAGFIMRTQADEAEKEGVLKISSFDKAYGGGYLTLTFIIDTEGLSGMKDLLDRHFSNLTEAALKPFVEKTLERINKVHLDEVLHVQNWYVEEINVHLTKLKGEEKQLVEKRLIPAFEKILAFEFLPVEWWPLEERAAAEEEPELSDTLNPASLKGLFQKWFKSG